MKKLTKRVAALLSIGCAAFLGLFHTSCHLIGGVEYGTPYMEYDVKVKVQSPDGNPIEGIEVAVVRKYHTSYRRGRPHSKIGDPCTNEFFGYCTNITSE